MKIYLYTVISSGIEDKPLVLTRSALIKRNLHRLKDQLLWSLFSFQAANYYTWEDRQNTNQGDIAIRLALAQIFKDQFNRDKDVEFVEIAWGQLSERLIDQANNECDLFVIGGSGYLHHDDSGVMNKRFKDDIGFIRRLKCPIISYAVGMNRKLSLATQFRTPDFPEDTISLLKIFMDKLALISVRDEYTRDQLLKVDRDANVFTIPDPALFLVPSISGVFDWKKDTGQINVGVNLAFHGPFCQVILKQNITIYVEFLKGLLQKGNYNLFYFHHSDAEKFVYQALRQKGIEMSLIKAPPEIMLDFYQLMDVHVGQMMHSTILSTNALVPTLSLAYDRKSLSFFQLLNQEDYCINTLDLSFPTLNYKFEKLVAERVAVKQQLQYQKERLKEKMNNFLEAVHTLFSIR